MITAYKNIFDTLNAKQIFHFKNYISSSQYLRAYNLVKKYLADASSILDWGCGSGHFSYFLLNSGYNVSAFTIEAESYLSEYLFQSFPGKYSIIKAQNPLDSLPYDDQSFDAVVSIGVLEHVRESGNTELNSLSEINRVLKPGGYFICYHFPNKYSLIEAVSKIVTKRYHHNYKYTFNDVKTLIESSGLQLKEFKRYGLLPRNTLRILPNSVIMADIYNSIDNFLSSLVNILCQNSYFVAKKIK